MIWYSNNLVSNTSIIVNFTHSLICYYYYWNKLQAGYINHAKQNLAKTYKACISMFKAVLPRWCYNIWALCLTIFQTTKLQNKKLHDKFKSRHAVSIWSNNYIHIFLTKLLSFYTIKILVDTWQEELLQRESIIKEHVKFWHD